MKMKRILATILSVAMLVGIFPMAALAEFYIGDKNDGVLKTDTTAANIPTIYFRLLNTSFQETTIDAVKTNIATEPDAEPVYPKFYIEMIAKNFTQFTENTAVIDKNGITQSGGLTNLVVKMQVDSDYLDIEPTAGGFDESTVKTRIRTNGKGHLTKTGNNGPETGEAYKSELTYTKRTGAAQVTYQPYDSDPTYADAMKAEETLLIMEAQLKKLTDANVVVFSVPDEAGSIQLGFGTSNANQWAWKQGSHLETYVDLNSDGIDFFPAGQVTIPVKTNVNGTVTETDSVKIKNDTTKKLSDLNLGTAPTAPDGKYFAGWALSSDATSALASDASIEFKTTDTEKVFYPVFLDDYIESVTGKINLKTINNKYTVGNPIQVVSLTGTNGSGNAQITWKSGKTEALTLNNIGSKNLGIYYNVGTAGTAPTTANSYTALTNPDTQTTVKYTNQRTHVAICTGTGTNDKVLLTTSLTPGTAGADVYTLSGTLSKKDSTKDTYPDVKVDLSALRVKITNADTGKDETKTLSDANAKVYATVKGTKTEITDNMTLTAPMSELAITVEANNGAQAVTVANTYKLPTVKKAELPVSFTGSVTDRDYNGANDNSVPTGISASVTTLNGDAAITVPGITYSYADGNASETAKAITATWTTNAGTFDNYTLKLPDGGATGITGKINPKELNGSIVVTVAQIPGATEAYTIQSTDQKVFTANPTTAGLVGTDTVTWTVAGTVSKEDVAGTGSGKTITPGTVTIAATDTNYKVGTITATATISDKPVASWENTDDIEKEIAASDTAKNTSDYLKTTILTETGANVLLPKTAVITYTEDGDAKTKTVNLTWKAADTNKYDTDFDAKSGTYTYTATISDTLTDVNAVGLTKTATITVTKVDITKPTVSVDATAKLGATVTLPEGGTTKAGTTDVAYTIEWKDANNNVVTAVDTSSAGSKTYTGTISYTNAPDWATKPTKADDSEDNEVECTVTVSDRTLESIAVDTTNAKLTYIYPNLTADFSGVTVKATYDNGDEATVTNVTYSATGTLPYGETEVTVTYEEGGVTKTATFTVTANKKLIKLEDLMFTATKKAGVADVTVEVDIAEDVIEEGDDVTIEADGAFDDDVAGEDKPVTITNIRLSGDAAANYELEATEGSGTGTIEAGTQAAPEKVVAAVDNKTNNIIVSEPTGDNVEYSIDGTNWTKDTIFKNLTKGTTYTVYARYAATASSEASPAATTEVTTYKYHVTRTKKNATSILDEVYTNESTVSSATDINGDKVFGKKPSSFKAYFTDSACKEAVAYPFTMQPETTLYYTVSSGGGSSSTPASYAVVFSAGAHGRIVSGKSSLNIASGEVIKELPVVEANPGYKFVGWSQDGGKTIINLADNPIKKATNFTAVYEEDVKPTPTPVVIPAEFTKPYASGYDGDVFLPNNNITRAELATMIARLMYGDELPEDMYRASFSDIPADAWYSKYVGYLENFGILDGYDEDGIMVFKPEQTITRAEMATVITRAQKFAVDSADNTFWDVEADYWAAGYIATLASRNIITGYADGSFAPTNPLTRAEAVVIINRLLDPSTAIVTFMPIDISGHWAENEIILAVNERQIDGTGVEVAPEQEETPAPEATPEAEADETVEPTAEPAA